MQRSLIGLQGERAIVTVQRLFEAAQIVQGAAAVGMRLHIAGKQIDRPIVVGQRVGPTTEMAKHVAAIVQGFGKVRL